MSAAKSESDLRRLLSYWKDLPASFKLLDAASLLNVVLFVICAILIQTMDIMSVKNAAILIFIMGTAGVCGYIRLRLQDDKSVEQRTTTVRQWFLLMGTLLTVTLLILLFYNI